MRGNHLGVMAQVGEPYAYLYYIQEAMINEPPNQLFLWVSGASVVQLIGKSP